MLGPLIFAAIVTALVVAGVTLAIVAAECPWLFERNTSERKMLLRMLDNLAEEPDEWERVDYNLYRHKPSSVSFVRSYGSYKLTLSDISFPDDSRGGRICARICRAVAEIEKNNADLAALQGMTKAYHRWMN